MKPTWTTSLVIMALWMLPCPVTSAQIDGRQEAVTILDNLPRDVRAKIQALAQLLDQYIKAGKLTDADIQRDMMAGRLGDTLRRISPEAARLLDDISEAIKNGTGPGEAALLLLLDGLGIVPP